MAEVLEKIVGFMNSILWSKIVVFVVMSFAIFIGYKVLFSIKNQTSEKEKLDFRGEKSSFAVSLGSKIGTGNIIGILVSLSVLSSNRISLEGLVFWVIVSLFVMLPLTYAEVYISGITKLTPGKYISKYLHVKLGFMYVISLITLYAFGFCGFQFNGLKAATKIFSEFITGNPLSNINIFFFIFVPIIISIIIVVMLKKENIFFNTLSVMVAIIVFVYSAFVITFIFITSDYIPSFLNNMIQGISDPFTFVGGVTIAVVAAVSRVIQTSEAGIATSALSSTTSQNGPRKKALAQVISVIITIVIAVIFTTYVASYGVNKGLIDIDSSNRLFGYFDTFKHILGTPGLIVLLLFFILSAYTTILGSFHFLNKELDINIDKKIYLYISLIVPGAILSILNFGIVFDIVDLLMMLVLALNVAALTMFVVKGYVMYKKEVK